MSTLNVPELHYVNYVNSADVNLLKNIKKILVATDCSGLDTPIMALDIISKLIGHKIYHHTFSSEIDKQLIEFLKTNMNPNHIYEDLRNRINSDIPQQSLYVAGFPCQSYSSSGKQLGLNDPRGTIVNDVIKFINQNKPLTFILENVKNILYHDNGQTFNYILKQLNLSHTYNIYHQVLNTLDYGIPQSRNRLYIIGINKKIDKGFKFPNTCIPFIPITSLLYKIPKNKCGYVLSNRESKALNDMFENDSNLRQNIKLNWVINLDVSDYTRGRRYVDYSPCLYTRCKYYLLKQQRHIIPEEALLIQGISPELYDWSMFSSEYKIYSAAGNAMSVNVLFFILVELLKHLTHVV